MSNTKKFTAKCVNCTNEDDVLTIGVGDDDQDPKNFFMIGRFDEDDLSVDECIGFQTEATNFEVAGSIESVVLTADKLSVTINSKGEAEAGNKEFEALLPEKYDLTKLKIYLTEIFDGSRVKLTLR
ncbi:Imm10 family immunity protein [Erwiniaceae bacterium BAC15a-03b]|uniref:Imm10 family immunity protein n=1 Tax=Winslowiella arboricola TaxID=2978220 RepID=A0A9J6PX91_9GAMM|nr:Imm10 family immunity protein [Winslowiella arboricola]MCU5775254.1 Imm10 family immunity protein [Winslowiella arboricola]MCU5780349.1 Imm10 family immunity protein [Winslowiella arboricola]